MKKIKIRQALTAVHVVEKEWLNPYNPIVVNLIGAGGTGSRPPRGQHASSSGGSLP